MNLASGHTRAGALLVGALLLFGLAPGAEALKAKKETAKKTESKPSGPLQARFMPVAPMITPMRIGITVRSGASRFAVWAPAFVFANLKPVWELKPGIPYLIAGGKIVEPGGRAYDLPDGERVHVTAGDYRVWANNRWYRGSLELIKLGGVVTVINLLDLEDYLLGVVPSEMPASWHPEALKAQAVAARSYAWAHRGDGSKWKSEGFDLVPDVRDQMYKGLGAEANSTYWAVSKTRGLVLKDAGKVKAGFYRAWVGDDPFSNLNIRRSTVPSVQLEKICGVQGIVGVTIKRWDNNGNAQSIQVIGQKKTREVDGIILSKWLKFSTAGILDVKEEGNNWVFTYRGPGNGALGLSQHGADMLAKRGWRFDQILQQYYQDPDGQLRLGYTQEFPNTQHGKN